MTTDSGLQGRKASFSVEDKRSDGFELEPVPQPQSELACCAAADDQLLVGGSPHGVAFSPDEGSYWQASWMDGVSGPVMAIAADPTVSRSGVMVAGSVEGGMLRTHNRGQSWSVCNFGLQDYALLAIAWAPVAPAFKLASLGGRLCRQ